MKNSNRRYQAACLTALVLSVLISSANAETLTNNNYHAYDNTAQGADTISPFASIFGALTEQDPNGDGDEPDESIYDFRGLTAAPSAGQTYFFLEDFQDGQFDVPGATLTATEVRTDNGRNGSVSKGSFADNIDEDDGACDGAISNPRGAVRFPTRVDFDAGTLGDLPTHAGIVLAGDATYVTISAYDSGDTQLETVTAYHDGGKTAFAGVISAGGISYVTIAGGTECDHFQYGRLGGAEVNLDNESVSSNAAPGTLVGNTYMVGTNGTFTFSLVSGADNDYFQIPTATTNLRTAAWIDSDSYSISIIGEESGGGGLVVTNDFTITVDAVAADEISFVVSADVQSGSTDGTVIGTAQIDVSGANFSIVDGRDDLFYFDGADLMLTNSASWGSIGTTNHVRIQAVAGAATNTLVVAAGVINAASSGTIFLFH